MHLHNAKDLSNLIPRMLNFFGFMCHQAAVMGLNKAQTVTLYPVLTIHPWPYSTLCSPCWPYRQLYRVEISDCCMIFSQPQKKFKKFSWENEKVILLPACLLWSSSMPAPVNPTCLACKSGPSIHITLRGALFCTNKSLLHYFLSLFSAFGF